MTTANTTENLKSLFTFPIQDEHWKSKLLIGTLLSIAGIVIFPYWFVLGYLYEIMRRVIVDSENPSLPEWGNWGQLMQNGLKLFGVSLIYSLPALILLVGSQLAIIFFIPLSESAYPREPFFPLIGMSVMTILAGMGMLLGLLSAFLIAVSTGHVVASGEFGAAFRVSEWWPILRKNFVGYFIAVIILAGVSWLANFASQLLIFTIVLCAVYPLFVFFVYMYLGVVGAAMFAQAYVEGRSKQIA